MDSTTARDSTIETTGPLLTKSCKLYFFIFGSLLSGFLIVIGLFGNCLSLTILGKERKRSSTIQALCLLAVADTCLLLAYCPFPIMDTPWARKTNSIGIFAAVYMFDVARICNQVSALLTMVLMWQRYVAVCLPHKAKQLCTVRIVNWISAFFVVAAFAFYFPKFFLYSIKIRDNGVFYTVSNPLMRNEYFQMVYLVILNYLVSYIIPVVCLLCMSVAILRSLKSHNGNIGASVSSQHARKDLTKSSIAIVLIYVLCQSVQPIRRILMWVYDPYMKSSSCGGELFYFSYVPHLALMLNSSANFGIYILFARGFRRKLVVFLTRRNVVDPNESNESSTQPKTSTTKTSTMIATGSKGTSVMDAVEESMKDNMAPSGSGIDGINTIALSEVTTNKTRGLDPVDATETIDLRKE